MADNPLAFPRPGFETPAGYEDGMTLRDWFAGQALAGLLANGWLCSIDECADRAFSFADAMIAEREK